jgi:predicted amidohydrolase
MLSKTKTKLMYTPGARPVTFNVRGLSIGLLSGMETQYPELFAEYVETGVSAVLLSTAGNPEFPDVFAVEAAGHAAANSIWVGYASGAGEGHAPAGIISPDGTWTARCVNPDVADITVADIDPKHGRFAREWRREARQARLHS